MLAQRRPRRGTKRLAGWIGGLAAAAIAVYFGGRTLLGVHTVRAGAGPAPLPEQGFSHGPLGRVRRSTARRCPVPLCETSPNVRERLGSQLDEATRAFCSQPRHVRIDAGRERIVLSAIFDWFRGDFAAHPRRIGAGEGMLDFVEHFARPHVSEALRHARENGYEVAFAEYDWSLNRATNR